jgi:hypothetical protein
MRKLPRRIVVHGILVMAWCCVAGSAHAVPRECSCVDIKLFKSRIAEVQGYLDAFRALYVAANSANGPTTFKSGRDWWDKYLFGGERPANIKDAGTASLLGRNVTQEFENAYCKSIVDAVGEAHELSHERFMWINALPILGGIVASGVPPEKYLLRRLAYTEMLAHEEELDYLKRALARLEASCNTWKCRCNQQSYSDLIECHRFCPPAKLGQCVAPTCLEIDRKTGKWTGKGY